MTSLSDLLESSLRLTVNRAKSAVDRFFSSACWGSGRPKCRWHFAAARTPAHGCAGWARIRARGRARDGGSILGEWQVPATRK